MKQLTPRQGTKTLRSLRVSLRQYETPHQGTKTKNSISHSLVIRETTYAPSGDENGAFYARMTESHGKQLTPRQGTKTCQLVDRFP